MFKQVSMLRFLSFLFILLKISMSTLRRKSFRCSDFGAFYLFSSKKRLEIVYKIVSMLRFQSFLFITLSSIMMSIYSMINFDAPSELFIYSLENGYLIQERIFTKFRCLFLRLFIYWSRWNWEQFGLVSMLIILSFLFYLSKSAKFFEASDGQFRCSLS